MKLLITCLPLAWIPACQWLGANFQLIPACVIGGIFVLSTGILSFLTAHRLLTRFHRPRL